MIYIINNRDDPFFNHATEEYLMNKFNDEIFMLWINRPSILIGKNQNTFSEINLEYIEKEKIEVVRRLSGGGAVYNDLGNMNFSFISYREESKREKIGNGFEKFALPVIQALKSLGVNAEFTGRNDIIIDGRKFSGNAQYFQKDKLLHHGTLLYDCDMSKLSLALKSKPIKFIDKSVKSVGSRVTNIADHMKDKMTLLEFKEYLKNYIIKMYNIKEVYELTNEDAFEINKIVEKRFGTWEWNYGKSPNYRYENSVKYPSGVIEYHLEVEDGIIKDISIYGDFFGEKDIEELQQVLLGSKHSKKSIEDILKNINVDDYIKGISDKQFIEGLLDIE